MGRGSKKIDQTHKRTWNARWVVILKKGSLIIFFSGPTVSQIILLGPAWPKKSIGTFKVQIRPEMGEKIASGQQGTRWTQIDKLWYRFFKFSDILFLFNFPKIWANVEFIPINLVIFKEHPVQMWRSCCTGLTYFPPPSHCDRESFLRP